MKTIHTSIAGLLALIFTVHAQASCLGDPLAMKEICEINGGTLEVAKGAYICRWGNAKSSHFVRFDCAKCLKGCNADGPLSKASFEKLEIRDPTARAQAQAQQIKLYSQVQQRRILRGSE